MMKLFEVREEKNRMKEVGVGDTICFFAGKWVVYCQVWCVHNVDGVCTLLDTFHWRTLMPLATEFDNCKEKYNSLVTGKNLLVWGIHPISVVNKDLFQKQKVSPFNLSIIQTAREDMAALVKKTNRSRKSLPQLEL